MDVFFYLKMFKLMFWKNWGRLGGGSNTQELESLERLSNAQVLEALEWWVSALEWSSRIC